MNATRLTAGFGIVAVAGGVAAFALGRAEGPAEAQPAQVQSPPAQTQPIQTEPAQAQPTEAQPGQPAADAQMVERGRYVVTAADCQPCHTAPGGKPFAGGRVVETPFGKVLSANITPGGLRNYTADKLYRTLHEGIGGGGGHLYPAMPYNYFTQIKREDSDAAFAYLQTLKPVHTNFERNQLNFPFNIRFLMTFWNWLYLHKPGEFQANAAKSAEWNRGAYLVGVLGHCGACHTPMNFAGAPKTRRAFQGGRFSTWFAPDLTTNKRTGLGGWSRPELVELLRTARNVHAQTSGEMGEVVTFSTSHLTDEDLNAIATYLGDLPPSPIQTPARPDPAVMRQGQAVWEDACSACHKMDGSGVPRFFPPVGNSANAQQRDATTMVHIILTGTRTGPTQTAPTPLSMPSYAWKLTDDQIAAVSTFIRNSWGNQASPVAARQVADLRKRFAFGPGPAGRVPRRELNSPNPGTFAPPHTDSRDNGTANAGRSAGANDTIDTSTAAPAAGAAAAPGSSGNAGASTQGPG